MQSSLLGALALTLAGALAACSDSTSPPQGSSTTGALAAYNGSASDTTGSDTAGADTIRSSTTGSSPAWLRFIAVAPHPLGIDVSVSAGPSLVLSESELGQTWTMTPSEVPHTITVTSASTSTVLASTQVTLAADTRYTVVFAQNSTGDTLFVIQDTLLLEDTLLTPPPGYLLHRIVNALPNVGAVDVYVRSGGTDLTNLTGLTPVISNLAFGAATPYLSPYPSSSGVYGIIVTAAGHPGSVLYVSSFLTDTGSEGEAMTCLLQSTYPDNDKPTGLLCSDDEPRIVNRWP